MLKTRFPVGRHLQQLRAESHNAFALPLQDREGPLYCEQLLRLIPSMRASFRGRFGNRDCMVKVFFSRSRHKHDCTIELNGLAHLASAGCRIPEILYVGPSSDQAASVLVMEWQADAINLAQFFAQHDRAAQTQMLAAVADNLARQHNAGCLQHDVHHSNFMWLNHEIVCVDGERVSQNKTPIAAAKGHDNLAQFCAQWPPRYDAQLALAIARYGEQRWGSAASVPNLSAAINRYRQQKLQRLFELQETPVNPIKHDHTSQCSGIVIAEWQGAEWQQILASPQSFVGVKNESLRWQHNIVDVKVWDAASWWQRWRHKSAAQRHFRYSQALQFFAIPCVATLGFVESWQHQQPRSYAVIAAHQNQGWLNWVLQHREQGIVAVVALLQQLHALHIDIVKSDFAVVTNATSLQLSELESLRHTTSSRRYQRRFTAMLHAMLQQLACDRSLQRQLAAAFVDLGWLAEADVARATGLVRDTN